MSVPRRRLCLGITEYLPHHRQATTSHHCLTRKRAKKVQDPLVLQIGSLALPPPRLLQVR